MDIHQFFRIIIPGYAFLIPLVFYLLHTDLGIKEDYAPIIAIIIPAGFPFGAFIEWITHAMLHLFGHKVIRYRVKTTRQILNIRKDCLYKDCLYQRIVKYYRNLFCFSEENIEQH